MIKTLLLATLTAPTSTSIKPLVQPSNTVITAYNSDKEFKIDFINDVLIASAEISPWGSTGSKTKESDERIVINWKDYADNRSEFLKRYPTVKINVDLHLGRDGVLNETRVQVKKEVSALDLFGGKVYRKYLSKDSHSSGSYNVAGETYVEGWSNEEKAYIKTGAYVRGGWDSHVDRRVTARVALISVTFIPKKIIKLIN